MVAPNSINPSEPDSMMSQGLPENRLLLALELLAMFGERNPLAPEFQDGLARTLGEIFRAPAAGLLFIMENSASLTLYISKDGNSIHHSKLKLDWENGVLERAIVSGSNLVASYEPDKMRIGALGPAASLELPAILCAPFACGDRASGALFLLNRADTPFQPSDPDLLDQIAGTAAHHIERYLTTRDLQAAVEALEISRSQLLHSRNVLRALFDSFPDGLYIVDREYMLSAVNMQRAMQVQQHPNLLVGRTCYRALFDRDDPCPECHVMETMRHGQALTRSRRDKDPEGEYLEWDIYSYPIADGEGRVVQAILLEQDITEQRRLELTLAQMEKLAAMGQWAASLAHEINNPLTAIIANAQLLKKEIPSEDDKHELVDLIARAGERANQVVRSLLDLARKEEFLFGPTDVNQTIQRSLEYLQHELVVRSVKLVFEPAEALPLINASPDHLQGVWLNLLTNAMDSIAMETLDGDSGEIGVRTRLEANEIYVTVSDNGEGIPAEKLARIFEPFYTTKAPGHGTGLGLPVCQRIIKQHGGRILVDSHPDHGTRFTVILPVS
jgi:two-component system NtrC family sensor kinase